MDEKKNGVPIEKSFNGAEKLKPSQNQQSQRQENIKNPVLSEKPNVEQDYPKKKSE
ncbi:MAG: hypothetical protein PHR06_05460 [Candidatus Cloacimonetes bacterium]|nr:hypothetical protein [Candidatus Cloacimonadota bacterium]